MNSKTFLAVLAVVCFIAVVSAQSSTNPIESLQNKASDLASSATNTAAATPTNENAANSLASGSLLLQLAVLACAFVASSLLV